MNTDSPDVSKTNLPHGLSCLQEKVQSPVLLISSMAGLGNYTVAEAISQFLEKTNAVEHVCIEQIISSCMRESDFLRHRWICDHCPFLLSLLYRMPLSYATTYWRERFFSSLDLACLLSEIQARKPNTIIASNHRAAFWIGALKRRRLLDASLISISTDYHFSAGWKYLFQEQIDLACGPPEPEEIPLRLRHRYRHIPLPVRSEYHQLAQCKIKREQVLITGGGWGLGPIKKSVRTLKKAVPSCTMHVVCGDNHCLYQGLGPETLDTNKIQLYGRLESLAPLMAQCAAVITKPGAVTIAEAYAANRKIFLLPGLPVTESMNAAHAIEHFGAERFSVPAFCRWYNGK